MARRRKAHPSLAAAACGLLALAACAGCPSESSRAPEGADGPGAAAERPAGEPPPRGDEAVAPPAVPDEQAERARDPADGGVAPEEAAPADPGSAVAPEEGGRVAAAGAEATTADGPAGSAAAGELRVDRDAREVSIPGLFVNPTQRLEVFACHESGPTHETVVAFRVEGERIYDALLEIGFRSPDSFWNATGPDEVRRALGDRALVLLRWESGGTKHELPAEMLIRDSEAGFPLFVRGFTFVAEKRLMGDPPVRRVPPAVEMTIGDPNRQGSVSSLFFHPNDLNALTPWMPPLEIDPGVVPDLAALVEGQVPCAVVIRRLETEVELLDAAARYRGDPEWRALTERLRPLAGRIDALKAAYVTRVGEIRALLERTGGAERADPEVGEELAGLVRKGRHDVATIHEHYIRLFAEQERFRAEKLSARQDLDPEIRTISRSRYDHGVAFEPRLAELETRIAEIAARGGPAGEESESLKQAFEMDIERLEIERTSFWAELKLTDVERKLVPLEAAPGDEYLRELHVEEKLRILADLRKMRARMVVLETRAEELRSRVAGEWARLEKDNLTRRRAAERQTELADLELERVRVLEELRWLRNFAEDDPARARENEAKRKALEEKKVELERRIAEIRKAVGEE